MAEPATLVSDCDGNTTSIRAEGIERRNAESNSRLFAVFLVQFLHRSEQARRGPYGNDIDLAIIAETIALGAIEPQMRDPLFRARFGNLKELVGIDGQRGMNALSVAAATGIPRETTRRKIKQLVAMDIIAETQAGNYVMKPGFLQSPPLQSVLAEMEAAFLQLMNSCQKEGLLQGRDGHAIKNGEAHIRSPRQPVKRAMQLVGSMAV